ncbi:hypothetical protein B0T21DRAFT_344170 [Apiosordaria backusii]|uniref:VWFA domain-containing protein n=1 Tax=Apiosordaria backusii TaxID=314023 RepID=A0AA40EZY7_9PEZI|nr:hypothetical protein B0T21DRAFT_344170 [Apiosordaria backusii]
MDRLHKKSSTSAISASDMEIDAPPAYSKGSDASISKTAVASESKMAYNSVSKTGETSTAQTVDAFTPTVPSTSKADDPYDFLGIFDIAFLIDDSGSMRGQNRWEEVRDALKVLAPICTRYDANGVDLYFLNKRDIWRRFKGIKNSEKVTDIFADVQPDKGTPTGARIYDILDPYVRRFAKAADKYGNPEKTGIKPLILIVITDGEPTDKPKPVIEALARRLDKAGAPPHRAGRDPVFPGRK